MAHESETVAQVGATLSEVAASLLRMLGIELPDDVITGRSDSFDRANLTFFSAVAPPAIVLDATLRASKAYLITPDDSAPAATIRFAELEPSDGREALERAVRDAHRDRAEQRLPRWRVMVDGRECSVSVRVVPIVDDDVDPARAVVVFSIVPLERIQLRETQAALAEQARFFEAVIEHIPNMVFVKEASELRFVRMNRAGEELIGVSREELIGKNDFDFFPADEARFFTSKDRAVLESGELLDIPEEPIHTPHGTRYLHTRKVPLADPESGEPAFLLGISEDITERREAIEAIERARIAAEEANVAKSRFLANMSHELRTPMTAIVGYSELLLEESTDPGVCRDLERILSSSEHLLSVINRVLDLSKIETGGVEVIPERFDIHHMLEGLANTTAPLLARNDNTLILNLGDEIRTVECDPVRLRQCVLNLVSNSAKFTHAGTITVTLDRGDDGHFRLTVEDDGIGMTRDQVDRAFDPFYQADTSGTRRYDGTGLGLTITRRFVEAMGGEIAIRSTPGVGSTFTVSLPGLHG